MDSIYTACPVVAETDETFVQHIMVGTERRRMEHVQHILWLAETEATIFFMHGGKKLKGGGTFNDYYGFATSFRNCLDTVDAICKGFGITHESSLELVVTATLLHVPVIETPQDASENAARKPGSKRKYSEVPDEWRKEVINPTFGIDGDTQKFFYRMLKQREIESVVVWSSKRTADENARIAAEVAQRWELEVLVG